MGKPPLCVGVGLVGLWCVLGGAVVVVRGCGGVVVIDRGGEGAGQDVKVTGASSAPKKPN